MKRCADDISVDNALERLELAFFNAQAAKQLAKTSAEKARLDKINYKTARKAYKQVKKAAKKVAKLAQRTQK